MNNTNWDILKKKEVAKKLSREFLTIEQENLKDMEPKGIREMVKKLEYCFEEVLKDETKESND